MQRVLDILKFLWVLFLAMVDGVTQWLGMLTKQYVDTSTVLCNERYYIIRNMDQVSGCSCPLRPPGGAKEEIHVDDSLRHGVNKAVFFLLQRSPKEEDDQVSHGSEIPTMEICMDELVSDSGNSAIRWADTAESVHVSSAIALYRYTYRTLYARVGLYPCT